MPRFKDENDFRDVETEVVDRPSFSNEVVRSSETGGTLVKDWEPSPDRGFDSPGRKANTAPSPKDDGDDEADETFIQVARPDDARRQMIRSSSRWPSTLWGSAARTKVNNALALSFEAPDYVIPCIERKVRREVLFARRKAGAGGAKRRRRRTVWSQYRC